MIIIKIRIQKNKGVLRKKREAQHLYCYHDCVTRGSIHRQAKVTFRNFAEVNFRDKR